MGALLGILGPLLPYIMFLIAGVIGYFSIKHKGAVEATAKIEKKQAAEKAAVEKKVVVAVSKDTVIDKKASEQIEQIKKIEQEPPSTFSDGDVFKF